ncbi:MAG TPA: SRPBCC family protein [Candidatus Thermoplasmatota archaeon]|nr:SRPBCC family protein [Candidatus Thermoplasmatota archaeon]
MPTVNKSIEVDVPVDRVYEYWSNFENFPHFMEKVDEVRVTGPTTTHWVVNAPTERVEWDATTTEKVPNERISWRAAGQSGQNGTVTFEPLDATRTRVNVQMEYTLDNKLKEKLATFFQIDDRLVETDLKRFKETVERNPSAAGVSGGTTGSVGGTTYGGTGPGSL